MGIGDCLIQFMSHDVGHGISAFIAIGAESFGRNNPDDQVWPGIGWRGLRQRQLLCRCVPLKRAGGMKTAESSTEALGVAGDGRESQGHIRGREDKINSIGIHGKLAII